MARGDQIYVMREFLNFPGVYEHHGIDCGDGTVIHYRKGTETVSRTSIQVFTEGRMVYVKHYTTSFIPEQVVRRAESRLGEQKYNLLFNNCEHFATWCKTGISESQQVNNFLPLLKTLKVDRLKEPIAEALHEGDTAAAGTLLKQALADVKVAWDRMQPEYNQICQEMRDWQAVAAKALAQGREDLARAALQRKLSYRKRAAYLKSQLDQLAQMTETLTENHLRWQRGEL